MNAKRKQFGVTTTETVVVVAVVAILTSFSLPAIRSLLSSMGSEGSVRGMISASLATARAIAAKEQRYAGIRFQKAYNPDAPLDPLKADQYMVFIVHDFEKTGLSPGFRVVKGIKPIKLPENLGVMDLMVRINHGTHWTDAEDLREQPLSMNYLDDTNPRNFGPDQKNRFISPIRSFVYRI